MIEQVTRIGDLYDLYGALLTARQREMVELYYLDDWSLAEVASHLQVSRQAVHDHLRRATEQLEHYEATLHLLESGRKTHAAVVDLLAVWDEIGPSMPVEERDRLESVLAALLVSLGETALHRASKEE
ncbi:MAG: YlxM family DNA-binding protein [Alicyclobacillus sp.]|nr:YlxM family DNA-binding protein [Alicyclobacillus sp.]